MKNYRSLEKKVISLFENNKTLTIDNEIYQVTLVGKPRPSAGKGECKTDVYVKLENALQTRELKISIKMKNAYEWQESKVSAARAEAIFGVHWSTIVKNAVMNVENKFYDTPVVFKSQRGNTQAGSVTMGWRLEITNKERHLSTKLCLDEKSILDSFYKGVNLEEEKTHALVNGAIVTNSGIAEHLLIVREDEIEKIEDILSRLIVIDDHTPDPMYATFIANNYRSRQGKIDGARPLAAYVNFDTSAGTLQREICFDEPLLHTGKERIDHFKKQLNALSVGSVFDLPVSSFIFT
jgi:hypothetical protein